jgi:hypothetical protein
VARVFPIDWRDEFSHLDPFLSGRGGVVRVCYQGSRCAPSAFLATLKSRFEIEFGKGNWPSLRIDPDVYSVRYLSDIRSEFERKLSMAPMDLPAALVGSPALNLFTDVHAEGNIHATISSVTQNVRVEGETGLAQAYSRDEWVLKLVAKLADFLKQNRFMIVINHGEPHYQSEFWRHMWNGRLANLTAEGLLLVHMFDEAAVGEPNDLAPQPEVILHLPSSLSERAQECAIEDVARIFSERFPSMRPEVADARADTLVRSHVGDIPRLHSQFAALILEIARRGGS